MILNKAVVEQGAIIAMATHGRSGVDRFLIGSVAEKVLRGSANPLLLVRAGKNRVSRAGRFQNDHCRARRLGVGGTDPSDGGRPREKAGG